jgi:predicted metal-dependent hydrolase
MNFKIDKLVRSKRKTFSIEISKNAELIVRVPIRATDEYINNLIKDKADWIEKHLSKMRSKVEVLKERTYSNGDKILFLGIEREIVNNFSGKHTLKLNGNQFELSSSSIEVSKVLFERWFKKIAKDTILSRAIHYSKITDLQFTDFHITSSHTRWGSCSAKNSINFTWRLIMSPLEVIDYVVIHELAHIKQKDHSINFWRLVAKFDPTYKNKVKWLKDNGYLLNL